MVLEKTVMIKVKVETFAIVIEVTGSQPQSTEHNTEEVLTCLSLPRRTSIGTMSTMSIPVPPCSLETADIWDY